MIMRHKAIKILSLLVKTVIVICSLTFIYYEIFKNENATTIFNYFQTISNRDHLTTWLIVVILLMPINWFLEAKKWQYLLSKIENISILTSVKSVLSGLTISSVLPNRMGEFLGRIAYVNQADRIKATLISLIGSISQMTITVSIGSLAFIYLIVSETYKIDYIIGRSASIVLFIVACSAPLIYFNTSIIFYLVREIKWLHKFTTYAETFKEYSRQELLKALCFSLARYLIFVSQFIFLLHIFEVDISIINAFTGIAASFFIVATIPSPALAEIGIREATCLIMLGLFSPNHLGIIAATFCLWLINIALPIIIGTAFVFQAHLIKQKNAN